MGDKSPRQHLTKKSGRSLKEKRADKRAKAAGPTQGTVIVPPTKH